MYLFIVWCPPWIHNIWWMTREVYLQEICPVILYGLHNFILAGGGSFNVHFITRLYPCIDFIQTIYSKYAIITYSNYAVFNLNACVYLQLRVFICVYKCYCMCYLYIRYPFITSYCTFVLLSQHLLRCQSNQSVPESKVHGANTGPTWVLSAPDWPHVDPMNLTIRVRYYWV